MYKLISNLSVKHKLQFLTLLTALSIFLMQFFVLSRYTTEYTSEVFTLTVGKELESLSNLLAKSVKPSLMFQGAAPPKEILNTLASKNNIRFATLKNKDGKVIASYENVRSGFLKPQNIRQGANPLACSDKGCTFYADVMHDKEYLGQLIIESDLSGLQEQKNTLITSIALVTFLSIVISILVAFFLQRIITEPILSLTELASRVSAEKNYSLRATQKSNDEIGFLTRTFNLMLEQIQKRDEEVTHSKDIAEQASRIKSEFVANTSHEIRTPINSIIGFTEMLEESVNDSTQKRYIGNIKTSAESLLVLINDILSISKIEAGRLVLDAIPTDLRAFFIQMLEPLKLTAKNKGLNFKLKIDKRLPSVLKVDGIRLGQVLTNLISNAIKFTEKDGSVEVIIKLLEKNAEAATILFSVVDSGIGISSSAVKSIFNPFEQADTSTTRKYGGTGLGLAISNAIVQMMGSEICLESREGQGSNFYFKLSLQEVAMDSHSFNDSMARRAISRNDLKNQKEVKILVVDDNALSREISLHRLNKAGYQVVTAENGKEAIDLTKTKDFDLILMDIQMPIMDGFEATSNIRNLEKISGRRTPIVAFTAHAIDGYRDVCLNAGMDDYITKPIKEYELLRFLRNSKQKF